MSNINVKSSSQNKIIRDFSKCDYSDCFWIRDILSTICIPKNNFMLHLELDIASTSNSAPSKLCIKNVVVFGTIIEIRDLFERGVLYTIDDGTGTIPCKYCAQEMHMEDMLAVSIKELEKARTVDVSNFQRPSVDTSKSFLAQLSDDEDSIFNNKTIHPEDDLQVGEDRRLAICSLWQSVACSLSQVTRMFRLGEVVVIHGRLYKFFGQKQIYINSIRSIGVEEEMTRIEVKLDDQWTARKKQNVKILKTETETEQQPTLRFKQPIMQSTSLEYQPGRLTFDNIDSQNFVPRYLKLSEMIKTPKRSLDENTCLQLAKKSTYIPPTISSALTFDSFQQNDVESTLKHDEVTESTLNLLPD